MRVVGVPCVPLTVPKHDDTDIRNTNIINVSFLIVMLLAKSAYCRYHQYRRIIPKCQEYQGMSTLKKNETIISRYSHKGGKFNMKFK